MKPAQPDYAAAPPLQRSFYDRPPAIVARELLNKILLHESPLGPCGGRIVEIEAYLASGDPACHAAKGQTRRNASMFGPPGHAYVYAIHAKWCLNTVTEPTGIGSAVLIRALEPLVNVELMQARRPLSTPRDLARGPARLCAALGVDRAQDGVDLTEPGVLWIVPSGSKLRAADIGQSTRIGVTSAHELELRYYLRGSPFVSGPKRLNA